MAKKKPVAEPTPAEEAAIVYVRHLADIFRRSIADRQRWAAEIGIGEQVWTAEIYEQLAERLANGEHHRHVANERAKNDAAGVIADLEQIASQRKDHIGATAKRAAEWAKAAAPVPPLNIRNLP